MTFSTSRATKLANKATGARLSSLITANYELSSSILSVKVLHSNAVEKALRDGIWSIYEANMYELSKNSSFGWDPVSKRKELFHSLSRFILVSDFEDTPLAFVMFRFEHEYDEDIIYCYEAQVALSAQGKGLGKKLLTELETLGKEFNMEKIILTVLKANARAGAFYKSIGFTLDPSSPGYDEEEVDYEILCKVIQ